MAGRIWIFLCLAALFIGIEGLPLFKGHKIMHKNAGHLISNQQHHSHLMDKVKNLKFHLSQDDIKRGISIEISAKSIEPKHSLHLLHRPRLSDYFTFNGRFDIESPKLKQLLKKPSSKIHRTLAERKKLSKNGFISATHTAENVTPMRSKRSVSKNLAGRKEMEIENLRRFYGSDDSIDGASSDSIEEEPFNVHHGQKNKLMKFVNSEDYRDYAFDTADNDENDLINEDNDLLERYYHPKRRAAYDDYGTFTDLMRIAATETEREDRLIRRVHYGDGLMNDDIEGSENTNNAGNEDVYDEYENYDDDY